MSTFKNSNKEKLAEIDSKTHAVFKRKGYRFESKLGEGAFGQVYKAVNFKDNFLSAVRVMDLGKITEQVRDKLPDELLALIKVNHPNMVRVYDMLRMSRKLFIFMEYVAHGDLSGVLKKYASYWYKQTSEVVAYLHTEIKIANGDIKLDSILLDERDQIKLTDFRFADLVDMDGAANIYGVSNTFCSTTPYYSPQLVMKQAYNPYKTGVWAMGVVLYFMLCSRFPFHFQDPKTFCTEQLDYPNYIRIHFNVNLSWDARALIELLFEPNEHKRPTMKEVLEHKWLAE